MKIFLKMFVIEFLNKVDPYHSLEAQGPRDYLIV